MKSKLIGIVILSTLFMSLSAVALVGAAATEAKVVVHMKGALDADDNLKAAIADFSYVEWEVVLGDITDADLAGADMLIMIQADPAVEYTTAELDAVTAWFDEGNKMLWVASDSDYPDGQELRPPDANAVLAAVGSKLRGEHAEIEDPVSNADASYRVYGVSDYCAPEYSFLVADVLTAQFHGCGIIIGYLDGTYYALDETEIDGVYVIMTSSPAGIVVDVSPPEPEAHTAGQEGTFALMALEEAENNNIVIATADGPFSHYSPMYKPEIQNPNRYNVTSGNPQQGATLFGNILELMVRNTMGADISALEGEVSDLMGEVSTLTSEKSQLQTDLEAAQSSASTMQLAAVAALIIGVVVGYFVGPMLKKD